MIISNSSPIIYLAKINKFDLLKILFKEIIIPKEVYEETVIMGKKENYFDAFKIEKAVKDGWVKVKDAEKDKEMEEITSELDIGEISLLNLTKKFKPNLILLDDASARTIAESLGFNVKGTLYVLIMAYKKKIINKGKIKKLFKELISLGFRISPELYAELLFELDKY